MRSVEASEDQHPELFDWLPESRCVRELTSKMGPMDLEEAGAEEPEKESRVWEGLELVAQKVLASGEDVGSFGRQLGSRDWERDFCEAVGGRLWPTGEESIGRWSRSIFPKRCRSWT